MAIFDTLANMGHEQLVFCRNEATGLSAIIGIHSTVLGPALGGLRLYPYQSEEAAIKDVLRLSRGMTYKAAVAGLNLGGGKAVIIGDRSIKSEGLFRAFGRHVESLNGRYITAEDMNTTVEDINYIRQETSHACGSSKITGGSGDPSPVTAWGTYHGIRACLEVYYGSPDVRGRKIAIQGIGSVGYHLATYLHQGGAKLLFTDISKKKLKQAVDEFGGEILGQEEFYSADCDVLAPCAIGGVINRHTIPKLRAPIIAGAANNQLDDEIVDGEKLKDAGIIYATDYVINAGGLISVYAELKQLPEVKAMNDAAYIFNSVKQVLNTAQNENITSTLASNRIAEERINTIANLKRIHLN
jgi:leucine dehydrogenase